MFERYGAFIARRARVVLVLSGIAMIAALVLGAGAFGKLKNGGFDDPGAESTRVQTLIDTRDGGRANLVLLVTAAHGGVDDAATKAAGVALTDGLASEPTVNNVISYWSTGAPTLRSTDGTQALIVAHIIGDDTQIAKRTDDLLAKYLH